MKKRILVIVVTYNGVKWLGRCLSSVVNSSVKADILVIDNCSTDNSVDFIKANYADAIIIESKENLGFGAANNIGLKYALTYNYDYVYLLNQDAWVEPNTFERLNSVSNAHPDYCILSPLQTNAEKTALDPGFAQNCPKDLISDSLIKRRLKDIYETKFVMAAHWFIPCAGLKRVGGFSSTFYHYGEDANYIDRVYFHGMKVGIVPDCVGVHDREWRKSSAEKDRYLFYCHGLRVLSNPNVKNRHFKLFKDYVRVFGEDKNLEYIKYFFKTVKDTKKISHNLKLSITLGAFL